MNKRKILFWPIVLCMVIANFVVLSDTNNINAIEDNEVVEETTVPEEETNTNEQTDEIEEEVEEPATEETTNETVIENEEETVLTDEDLGSEYNDTSGIDSIKNSLTRDVYSGYQRDGNYLVHGNDDLVYNAYTRKGSTFYIVGGGISTTYKKTREIISANQSPVKIAKTTTLYTQPFFSARYKTATTVPAGYYTAINIAGPFVYINTDNGSGWVQTNYNDNGDYIGAATGSEKNMSMIDIPETLSVSKVNGIPIYTKIIPFREASRTGNAMRPQYVTIHNTASTGKGANASAHANLQYNGNSRSASWHFTVDNTQIWQSIPMNENAWHAGDSNAMGNIGTVAIEICENSDGNYAQAERNAAYLTAQILYENNLPSNAVRTHGDWSGKNCPHNVFEGTKGTMGWTAFCNLVASYYNQINKTANTSNVVGASSGKTAGEPTVLYQGKSQKVSWLNQVTEPNTAGTTGRSLALYQLRVQLNNVAKSAHLSATVKNSKQTLTYDNIESNTVVGSDGLALRQINFDLENVAGYHLEYRVHCSNVGWQGWVKEGSFAGDGKNDIQAVDFRLVKDASVTVTGPKIYYNGHIADVGWQEYVPDAQLAGTTGKGIFLQALHVGFDGKDQYKLKGRVFVQDKGWITYDDIKADTVLGTTGQNQAIRGIDLSVDNLAGYSLQYRVHMSDLGWSNWTEQGSVAGNTTKNIEAINIRLVESAGDIESVSLDKNTLNMSVNTSTALKATINPSNTSMDKTITWSSSNSNIATVDSTGKITAKAVGTAVITATTSNQKQASCNVTVSLPVPNINYQTHVQDIGWQGAVSNGNTAGTSGQSKRLEGIKMNISNSPYTGTVQYQTHIQNIGWQAWKQNNELSGTQAQSKRLEAIRVRLTGDLAEKYDVYYRVHAQHFGWLDWAKNGEAAGTASYGYRLEAIQIQLVEKGSSKAPTNTQHHYYTRNLYYSTHVQNIGWQENVWNGATSGTVGRALQVETIRISLFDMGNITGGVEYKVHVQDLGWQGWVKDGAQAGTTGRTKRLEALQVKLTGEAANQYDIYYRTHIKDYGWLDWAKNGESAGSEGLSKRIEAVEIRLVSKGQAAPGGTTNPFKK